MAFNRSSASLPPMLTFDPSIEASRRAAKRGLQDLKVDTRRAEHYLGQDWRTERKDLRTDKQRGLRDIRRASQRGQRDIGYQRKDTKQSLARGTQDFATELDNLIYGHGVQAHEQAQAAGAAGVGGGSVAEASAAAHAANIARERRPLDTSLARLTEDTATTLGRLDTSSQDLRQDTRTSKRDLKKDVRHDLKLGRREYQRTMRDLETELDRAIREQRIGDVDSILQAIWSARITQPGVFSSTGAMTGDSTL